MGKLIDRLQRDKYVEVFLKRIQLGSKIGFLIGNTERYLIFPSPDKKDPPLKNAEEDFLLLSEWIRISWDKSPNVLNYNNENIVIKILNKKKLNVLIYNRDKCDIIDCNNIETYLKKVFKLSQNGKLYYRGQASFHDWIPSLYRKNSWIKNEAVLNAKVVSRHVEDFQDCHTTIERLIKLKHFNQPSRLYDIVANPLMALYFACESGIKEKSDGMVALIYSNSNEEKYSLLSDTVIELSSLSNVARFDELCNHLDKTGIVSQRENACITPGFESSGRLRCYNCTSEDLRKKNQNHSIQNKIAECRRCGIAIFLSELAHQCKKESGIESYWDDVSLRKIDQCIVVHPELNNARIIQQQGLFILCGLNPQNPYEPPKSLYDFFENNTKRTYLYFSNRSLIKCNEELIRLGINRSQVYFDLEKTIEFEKEKYE